MKYIFTVLSYSLLFYLLLHNGNGTIRLKIVSPLSKIKDLHKKLDTRTTGCPIGRRMLCEKKSGIFPGNRPGCQYISSVMHHRLKSDIK